MWLLGIRSFQGMYTEGRLRSVGVVWRNTNEKECSFPDCNDKRVWGINGFCGNVEFVFRMFVSTNEVQLDAVTMICIPRVGMWRKLGESLMVFLVRNWLLGVPSLLGICGVDFLKKRLIYIISWKQSVKPNEIKLVNVLSARVGLGAL